MSEVLEITLTNMVMIQDPATGKLLVQDRIKSFQGIAFPGGKAEPGESIYDSAVREIREETGYEIRNLQPCGFIYWEDPGEFKYFTFFYKTSDFSGELIGETAEGKVFWIDPEELQQLQLAPNMDKYLVMFSEPHTECYCKLLENGEWDVVYR